MVRPIDGDRYDKHQYYETSHAGKGPQPRKVNRTKWEKGYDGITWKSKRKEAK